MSALPTILLNAMASLRASRMRGGGKFSESLTKFGQTAMFSRSEAGPDNLFKASYAHVSGATCEHCSDEQQLSRETRESGEEVRVHYGTIASSHRVIKDAITRDELNQKLGGVLCFELEAAGLASSFPCILIRGVCDYAD